MARKGLLRQVIFPVSWRGYCSILSPFLFFKGVVLLDAFKIIMTLSGYLILPLRR